MKLPPLILIFTSVFLYGCFQLPKGTPSTAVRHYVMTLPESSTPVQQVNVAAAARQIGISPTEWPAYLERRSMVLRTQETELRYLSNHQWAEFPQEAFSRVLSQSLSQQHSLINWQSVPWSQPGPSEVLKVAIHRFEGTGAGDVVLEGSWQLTNRSDGNLSALETFVLRRTWEKGDYNSMAEAHGLLIAELATRIVNALTIDLP